jgi:hypothetical protein
MAEPEQLLRRIFRPALRHFFLEANRNRKNRILNSIFIRGYSLLAQQTKLGLFLVDAVCVSVFVGSVLLRGLSTTKFCFTKYHVLETQIYK